MKRRIFLVFLSVMLVSSLLLMACSSKDSDTAEKPADTNTETPDTNTPTTPETPDVANGGDGWILATDKSKIPAASKARTDTIVVGMQEPAGIFNPQFHSTSYDRYINDVLFDYLLEYELDGSFKLAGAKEYKISDDGLVYTFTLRDDMKFSDGTPVTAKDVEFTYYVFLDPAYDGESDLTLPKIKGWEAYKNGDATTIEGIKVVDDHTIEITVEEPKATTLGDLAGMCPIMPKHYYGNGFSKGNLGAMKELNQKPLGSGPFTLTEYIPGQEVRLAANPNYWDGAPKIAKLIFKSTTEETNIQVIQTGEADFEEGISVNQDNVELLKSFGFLDLSMLLNNGYGYIAFNHKLPKFQDKRVRQALTYGLNREEIVFAYSQGFAEVLNVPQSKVSWAYPDESQLNPYPFDLEKAKQLLDEAGWIVGDDGYRYKDGEKFTINFSATSPNPVNDAIIPYATENYKELGIEFVAEQLEFNAVVEKRKAGKHEMLFLAWGLTPEPDPTNLFHTNGSQNDDGYSNPEADALMEAGVKELDQAKRKEIYQELNALFNDDLPYIFMYQRKNMNVVNSRIQGFDISPYRYFSESLHKVVTAE